MLGLIYVPTFTHAPLLVVDYRCSHTQSIHLLKTVTVNCYGTCSSKVAGLKEYAIALSAWSHSHQGPLTGDGTEAVKFHRDVFIRANPLPDLGTHTTLDYLGILPFFQFWQMFIPSP